MAEQPVWENVWPQLNTLHTVGTVFIFRCFMVLGSLAVMLLCDAHSIMCVCVCEQMSHVYFLVGSRI